MSLASEGKLKAPKGMYRVVGIDTFEAFDADYLIGDYKSRFPSCRHTPKRASEDRNSCQAMTVACTFVPDRLWRGRSFPIRHRFSFCGTAEMLTWGVVPPDA